MTLNQHKINTDIISSLKSEPMGKLINRLQFASFEIKFTRLDFENACGQAIEQAFSKPCLVNLISKDTHLAFSINGLVIGNWQPYSKFLFGEVYH